MNDYCTTGNLQCSLTKSRPEAPDNDRIDIPLAMLLSSQIYIYKDGWLDEWMDGWMNGWMVGWVDHMQAPMSQAYL